MKKKRGEDKKKRRRKKKKKKGKGMKIMILYGLCGFWDICMVIGLFHF